MGRVGHLVVADDVTAVERDAPAVREVGDQLGRGPVLGQGVGGAPGPAFVLDPDRMTVPPGVAGVPRHVADRDELHDLALPRDDEMRRASTRGFCSVRSDPMNRPSVSWMTIA